ncbi:MAG: response regulator [Rhodocyclaceae bacterium]|nr:response regulator [Rhodocyclaceae bacterium]
MNGLTELTASLLNTPDLKLAVIQDRHGLVHGSTDNSLLNLVLDDRISQDIQTHQGFYQSWHDDVIDSSAEVFSDNVVIGRTRIILGTETIQREIDEIIRQHVIKALLAIVIGSLAIWQLVHSLTRRLVALSAAADRIAGGELDIVLEDTSGKDEISRLSQDFMQMTKALAVHQHDLETAIKERTAELVTAKQAAEIANQTKTRFLAAISHDLRQPLHAIGLFNEALAATALTEKQIFIRGQIKKSVDSLNEMLNQLLDISKLEAGKLIPELEAIQSEDLLETIIPEFESSALERGLRLNFFLPRQGILLFSDKGMLLAILRNLVSNALKYTRQGGVLVSIRQRGHQALIQVWDTGTGIDPEHLDKIFDEYFQIGNPERDHAKGFGLGLAIVKHVSKLLGVPISCHSRVGKGSVFQIHVPLFTRPHQPASCPLSTADIEAVAANRFGGKQVVVIEDDAIAANALKLSLEMHGMQVALFTTAEAALESADTIGADYYVSDFRLPGMDGLQLLDILQHRSTTPIRALLLTGDTSPDRIALAHSAGWTVLIKPVELSDLLAALEPAGSI